MLGLNRLPTLYNPLFKSERFRRVTNDRFFIVIDARDPKFDEERDAPSCCTSTRRDGGGTGRGLSADGDRDRQPDSTDDLPPETPTPSASRGCAARRSG